MNVTDAWGAWCVVVSVSFVWPQVWRCIRHDTTHGISSFATLQAIMGASLWTTYGLIKGNVSVWSTNLNFIVAQILIATVLIRHDRMPRPLIAGFATTIATLLGVGLATSGTVIGWMGIIVSGSGMIPVVLHVRQSHSLHGVSVLSWIITVVSSCSWVTLGFLVDDPIIIYTNYFTVPLMLYVIVKSAKWRRANGVPLFVGAA